MLSSHSRRFRRALRPSTGKKLPDKAGAAIELLPGVLEVLDELHVALGAVRCVHEPQQPQDWHQEPESRQAGDKPDPRHPLQVVERRQKQDQPGCQGDSPEPSQSKADLLAHRDDDRLQEEPNIPQHHEQDHDSDRGDQLRVGHVGHLLSSRRMVHALLERLMYINTIVFKCQHFYW